MDLTAGGLLVDDAAGIIDAEEAVNADAAQFRIDPDFRELRAEGRTANRRWAAAASKDAMT